MDFKLTAISLLNCDVSALQISNSRTADIDQNISFFGAVRSIGHIEEGIVAVVACGGVCDVDWA